MLPRGLCNTDLVHLLGRLSSKRAMLDTTEGDTIMPVDGANRR